MVHPALSGTECRPRAPVAEGGPVGLSDGGNRRDWFPGVRGQRAASGRIHIVTLFIAFTLDRLNRLDKSEKQERRKTHGQKLPVDLPGKPERNKRPESPDNMASRTIGDEACDESR